MRNGPEFNSDLPISPGDSGLLAAVQEQQKLVETLQGKLDESTALNEKNSDIISALQKRINVLEEYLRLLKQKRFGSSSEKNHSEGQLDLFNEAELLADGESDCDDELEQPESASDKPEPKPRKRKKLSKNLPRVRQNHYLSEQEKEGAIDTFFEHVKDELDIVPAKVQVIEHWQEKAVFVDEQGQRKLKAASRPAHPLGKAIASVALLAYLIVSKYADGLPLYRLC